VSVVLCVDSGALVIVLGLLSCLVNMDYKATTAVLHDGYVGHHEGRDDDDVVCFGEPRAYPMGGLSQDSAATVSPQDALRHRQAETVDLLSRFLSLHGKTARSALEVCRVCSVDAEAEDECCGCDRCWCVDSHWPPAFWNELHIQRMMSTW
jgi:hypothetical protein